MKLPRLLCTAAFILHPSSFLLAVVLLAGHALPAHAALVTWGTAQNITGDADVDLSGTLVDAFNVGGPSVAATTINGVTFAPFAIPSGSPTNVAVGNYTLTSGTPLSTALVTPSLAAPFSSLSATYRALLGSAASAFTGFFPVTLTMSGLTEGATYEFEWWANRSNNVAGNRSTATAGNSVTLDWNTTNTQGALGQFAIGTFTADATSQTIDFRGPESTTLFNGFQLRQLAPAPAVPEPGTALAGLALLGLVGLRRRRMAASALALAFILHPSSFILAQGLLTPPGAPAPLFKTLTQLEPRTDLQATPAPPGVDTSNASYHFIITQPGSYYLSGNLGVTKTNGIQINAEGVTLDLHGFRISRASGTGGNGIEIVATAQGARVRNGSIKGFADGITSLIVGANRAFGSAFRDLAVSGCTSDGIRTGDGAVVESCRAHDNSGLNGIFAGAGSTLTNCTANANTAQFGIGTANGVTLLNCSAYQNVSGSALSAGFITGAGCTITSCTSRENTSSAAVSTATTGMGFSVGVANTIQNCTAGNNEGGGIRVDSESVARDNLCNGNGSGGDGAGIHATGSNNRIESNNVTENDRGIDVDLAGNIILKNTAADNTPNYVIVANNVFGAIVDRTAPASAAVNGSNAASSAATTDPWANFSY